MRKPDYEPVVGMLVQGIDDEWGVQKANCPVRGLIYRVAAVEADITLSGPLGRTLWRGIWIGVVEATGYRNHAPEFSATCFKPVDPKRLDVFRAHLTKAPGPWVREGADA